jgi:hypothetical protein
MMDIIVSILGILIGLLVTLWVADRLPRPIQKLLSIFQRPPSLPAFKSEAVTYRDNYVSRLDRYLRQLDENKRKELGILIGDDPLTSSIPLKQPFMDCICTTLVRDGRGVLLLPSGDSSPDVEGVGRTALTIRLLNLKIPYTKFIGLDRTLLEKLGRLTLKLSKSNEWNLLISDIGYLGVSNGMLCVTPTKGEKLHFLWDLVRHLYRSTKLDYSSGSHRDPQGLELRAKLFNQLECTGFSHLYADISQTYPVHEIFVLRRNQTAHYDCSIEKLTGKELTSSLEKSLLISSEKHKSLFWKRSESQLRHLVRYLLNCTSSKNMPVVRELVIDSKGGEVPGFLYDRAIQLINAGMSTSTLTEEVSPGTVHMGVDRHNAQLYSALSSASTIKMLVTTGEKVFNDGVFWRTLAKQNRKVDLEILMLDPQSKDTEELELIAYWDKEDGFVRKEIEQNIEVIRKVQDNFQNISPPKSVQCWLYQNRPPFRMTFLGDQRVLIALYFPNARTGSETLFFDVYGSPASKFFQWSKDFFDSIQKSGKFA